MAISDETQSQPPSSTRSAMTRTPLTSMILEGFPRGHPVARKILLSSRDHFDLRYLVVQIVQLTCGNVMTEFTLVCPFVKCSFWTVYRFLGLSTWGCLQWKPEHRSPSWSSNFFNLLKTWKIPVQWVQSQNEHDIDCTFCNQATCIQRRWHCLFPTVLWWISTWPSCSSKPVYTGQCIQSVSHLLQLQGSHPIFFFGGLGGSTFFLPFIQQVPQWKVRIIQSTFFHLRFKFLYFFITRFHIIPGLNQVLQRARVVDAPPGRLEGSTWHRTVCPGRAWANTGKGKGGEISMDCHTVKQWG